MRTLLVATLLLLLAGRATASAWAVPPPTPPPSLQKLAEALVRPLAVAEAGVSSACRQHSQLYLRALGQLAPWAMHMYDASTKIPSSIMAGNIQHLGNFDQCVAVRVTDADTGADVFRGKHCSASVAFRMPPAPARPRPGEPSLDDLLLAAANASGVEPGETSAWLDWAFCVPSSCTARDLELALGARLFPLSSSKALISIADDRCLTADGGGQHRPLNTGDIAFICLLVGSVYVVAASTVYDLLTTPRGPAHPGRPALLAFSLLRNAAELMSTSSSGDTLGCLHGLRALSIVWVVLLHCFYNEAVAPNVNRAVVAKLGDYWGNMVLMNATLATDTFFLLSGALLAYSFLRRAGAASRFNPLAFYWHRYVRLTPVYAVVIWFYASLLVRLGSGPLWDRVVGREAENCVANWWTNLVYVNNFVQLSAPCMNQTWYLAVDMQLFWLSPLVLVPLSRWPRLGRVLLAVLVVASVATPLAVTFSEKLSAAMLYTLDQAMVGRVFVLVYTRVYNRGGPYLVGMALGCVLQATRGRKTRLARIWVVLGWTLSAVVCLAALFGVAGFYQRDHLYSALEAGLYAGLHRTAWATGVAWIVFACVAGHGGAVNALLSWRPFAPLARLSYCVYLSHYAVIMVGQGLRRSPGYFSVFLTVQNALGTLAMSLVVSVVLALAYEMPFMALDRALMPKDAAPKKAQSVPVPPACTVSTIETGGAAGQADLRGYDNVAFEKLSER